jgi:hypothetical protein
MDHRRSGAVLAGRVPSPAVALRICSRRAQGRSPGSSMWDLATTRPACAAARPAIPPVSTSCRFQAGKLFPDTMLCGYGCPGLNVGEAEPRCRNTTDRHRIAEGCKRLGGHGAAAGSVGHSDVPGGLPRAMHFPPNARHGTTRQPEMSMLASTGRSGRGVRNLFSASLTDRICLLLGSSQP